MRDCFEGVHIEVDPPCSFLLAGYALVPLSVDGGFSLRLEINVEPLAILRFFCRRQALFSALVLPSGLLVLLATLCLGGSWHIIPILTPTMHSGGSLTQLEDLNRTWRRWTGLLLMFRELNSGT